MERKIKLFTSLCKNKGLQNKRVATLLMLFLAFHFTMMAGGVTTSTTDAGLRGTPAAPQEETVKGTVVDEDNAPIPGVSIIIKGTTTGTTTDFDGNFTLENVPGDAILVFSFIGMQTQEVAVAGQTTFNVTMKLDVEDIDEVVVVGYGIQKKSNVTGAIASVKSEDMENRTIANPLQALAGKTAGTQVYTNSGSPGASPTIRIRGVNSNTGGDPLYVVDGRVADDIGGIDPNDIESMEILKDAASAAIYGAQAGNGVILITTKKGKKGQGSINYDFQYTLQSIGQTPKVMNSEEFIDYWTEDGRVGWDVVNKYWDFKQNTNWVDETFETSAMQRHSLSFMGGNENGTYYLSGSYLDNDGMVAGDADTYKRYTGMFNSTYNIKPWLEVGSNNQIEYYQRRSVSEGSEYGSLILSTLQLDPLTPVTYTVDNMPDNMTSHLESYLETGVGEILSDGNGNYYSVSPYVQSENVNPFIMRDRSYSKTRGFNINGTTFLNLKPIDGLVLTTRLSYLLGSTETYGYDNDYYASTQAFRNFVATNASTYANSRIQWENFANYMKSFGKHDINVMAGTSYTYIRSYGVSASISGTDTLLGVQQDNPNYMYFDYMVDEATRTINDGSGIPTAHAMNAYFGRASYTYNNKYMAQFSLRADAFDSGYLDKTNRWGYFPAASVGWVVSNESFMSSTAAYLNHLKLRASWGQNGSLAGLGGYAHLSSVVSTGSYPYSSSANYTIGYLPSYTGNPELSWETHEQTNIGVDARLLNSRLTLGLDYFKKNTKDLILNGITPSTIVGNTASPINAGNIVNQGLELELGWQDKRGDFNYGARGNISTIKNEVTYIHQSLDYIPGASFHTTTGITRFEVGKPAWYMAGYEFAGIDEATGDPTFVDQNGDDLINDDDKVELGSGIPDFTYGLTLNAAYKGFDIVVFGQGSYGNEIYSCLNRTDYVMNKITYFTDDRWTAENTDGTTPRAGANDLDKYYTSSAAVLDGSYFKIKQIQLGYTLPKNILDKVGIERFRIYASLEDYFTFTKYPGFDPEVTGVGNALGVDKGVYPLSKKMIFGVNLSF